MKISVDFKERGKGLHYEATLRVLCENGANKEMLAEAKTSGDSRNPWEPIAKAASQLFLNKNFAGNMVASMLLGETLVEWALGWGYSTAYQEAKRKRAEEQKRRQRREGSQSQKKAGDEVK